MNIVFIGHQLPCFPAAITLRKRVFCDEQGVPVQMEHDEYDAIATHCLFQIDDHTVATGRVLRQRVDGSCVALSQDVCVGDVARIGRMAVDSTHRKQGYGAHILAQLEACAKESGLKITVLHAQIHAREFYSDAGYKSHGIPFFEAGIEHIEMIKELI